MKYVLVSGGVISGIGKGVIASSVGFMFKACGLRVTSIKIDPCMLLVWHLAVGTPSDLNWDAAVIYYQPHDRLGLALEILFLNRTTFRRFHCCASLKLCPQYGSHAVQT